MATVNQTIVDCNNNDHNLHLGEEKTDFLCLFSNLVVTGGYLFDLDIG